jgi:hypothetical protein
MPAVYGGYKILPSGLVESVGLICLSLLTPTLLWKVFKKDYESRARSVFIAMPFRDNQTLRDVRRAMDEAIEQFNADYPKAPLAPIRVDAHKGASYEIPARVFQEIDQSSLMIADLTDERPNVYCEAGYAKSRGIPSS